MWSVHWVEKNLVKISDKNGGPLLVSSHFGSPYCKIRSCKHCIRLSEILE